MTTDIVRDNFLDAVDSWICENYAVVIRYLAIRTTGQNRIWVASINISPLEIKEDLDFQIHSNNLLVGQIQRFPMSKKAVLKILRSAANGIIELDEECLTLPRESQYDYYSEMDSRDRWFSDLHLQIAGSGMLVSSTRDLSEIDNILRVAEPPFDGLSDVCNWLQLATSRNMPDRPTISVRVAPPCDLIFENCALEDDRLRLTIRAHSSFDVTKIGLAIRTVPGVGLTARRQIAGEISWAVELDGLKEGVVQLQTLQSDSALAILMIGFSPVRRQWFLDPSKARNARLLAVQHFDKDLRMLKQAVFDSPDSAKFEHGVATLLFLLGFAPAVQLESDAPDIIVVTPAGKLAIVECTTKIADFSSKNGKLVDRRGALSKSLATSGYPMPFAILICRLPRDQIAAQATELRTLNTILLTREDLLVAFDRLRYPVDSDKMLDEAIAQASVRY